MGRWEELQAENLEFEVVEEAVAKEQTPLDRLKYAMSCKPMKNKAAEETYVKIASMCKSFQDMPMPIQDYIFAVEEEFGYQPPETIV